MDINSLLEGLLDPVSVVRRSSAHANGDATPPSSAGTPAGSPRQRVDREEPTPDNNRGDGVALSGERRSHSPSPQQSHPPSPRQYQGRRRRERNQQHEKHTQRPPERFDTGQSRPPQDEHRRSQLFSQSQQQYPHVDPNTIFFRNENGDGATDRFELALRAIKPLSPHADTSPIHSAMDHCNTRSGFTDSSSLPSPLERAQHASNLHPYGSLNDFNSGSKKLGALEKGNHIDSSSSSSSSITTTTLTSTTTSK